MEWHIWSVSHIPEKCLLVMAKHDNCSVSEMLGQQAVAADGWNCTLPGHLNLTGTGQPLQGTVDVKGAIYWISIVIHLAALPPCLLGNILVPVVLIKYKRLRTKTNMLILSLALADILVGLAVIPTTIADLLRDLESAAYFCTAHKFLVTFSLGCSLFAMLLISLDRYLAVAHPFKYVAKMTKRIIRWSIVFTWLLMLAVCFPIFFTQDDPGLTGQGQRAPPPDAAEPNCNPAAIRPQPYAVIIYTVLLAVLTLNSALYLWVARVAVRQQRRIRDETSQRNTTARTELRSTKISLVMFGVFILFWIPYMGVLMLLLSDGCELLSPGFDCENAYQLTLAFGMINSGFNCYVYAWQKQDFRWAIKSMLWRPSRKHRISSLMTTTTNHRTTLRGSSNSTFMLFSTRKTELTMIASVVHPSVTDAREFMTDMRRVASSSDWLSETAASPLPDAGRRLSRSHATSSSLVTENPATPRIPTISERVSVSAEPQHAPEPHASAGPAGQATEQHSDDDDGPITISVPAVTS